MNNGRNEQVDILIFGAHPDDAEIGMGGTIARHVEAGLRVGICDLTAAEMSSNGNVELRRKEAEEASAALGLSARSCLHLPDRGLRNLPEQIEAIVDEIRRRSPRIVFAPYWQDRHPDHNACSALVEEAVFNAKLRRYIPELPPVQVEQLVYYYINDIKDVSLVVDTSRFFGRKQAALAAYRSQFETVAGADIVQTPLNQRYLERVEARDSLLAQARGWSYAEGFAIKNPHAVSLFIGE